MTDQLDLTGVTPESWLCVDCGINTAPGYPTRVELERSYKTSVAMKKLSGEAPPITFNDRCEVFMVRDAVWKAVLGWSRWAGVSALGVWKNASAAS